MKRSGIIALVVVAILVFWAISARNGFATASAGIDGKWGDVEKTYQRKKNIYDNVVATIKGAARNEDTTLIKIVQMRSKVPDISPSSSPEQVAAADKQLNSIGRAALAINVEAYPTLQATGLYKDLQAQIEGTENRVTVAIGDWNQAVTDYNMKIIKFPANVIAGLFGYSKKQNFKSDADAKDTKVDFGN